MTGKGKNFAVIIVIIFLLSGHSAYVHYLTWSGERLYNRVVVKGKNIQLAQVGNAEELLDQSLGYLEDAYDYGMIKPVSLERELASIYIFRKDYEKASIHLSALLDKDPENHEAHLRFAKILFLAGKEGEAIAQLKEIVESPAIITAHDRQMRAEAHLTLGHIEEKNNFFSAAQAHYEAAIRDQPRNPEALLALGVIYTTAGKFGAGENYLLQCDSLMPGSPVVLNNLSVIYLKTGRADLAVQCLQKILTLQPDNSSARYNLGMVLFKKGQTRDAIGCLQEVARAEPRHLNAHLALANIFERTGDQERAAQEHAIIRQLQEGNSAGQPSSTSFK